MEQAVYTFQNYDCKNNLPYGDDFYKIVMNTTSPKENTPPELMSFFDYVNNMEVPEDDTFIQSLHYRVEDFNTSEWRRRLMTLEEQMRLEQEKAFAKGKCEGLIEGRSEGLIEGKNQGKNEERIENARKMKSEGIDICLIAKITGLTAEEIEKL